MKTITLRFFTFSLFAILFFVAVSSSSCKKDDTCHGTVTVKDSTGNLVSSAAVHLDAQGAQGASDTYYDGTTDGSGVVVFSVKLPAVFDVTVKCSAGSGRGLLRLDEPGKSAETTVIVK